MWVFSGGIYSIVAFSVVFPAFILLLCKKLLLNKKYKIVGIVMFSLIYTFLIVSTELYDLYLNNMLNQYDLDGDGVFSPSEMTAKQQEVFKKVINDSGRNLVYVTGAIYSAFITGIVMLILYVVKRNYKLLTRR